MARMQREVHLTGRDLMGMVQLRPEDVGKYALVPGPRERADAIVKKLENPIKNFSFMEYTMHTGTFNGIKVTAINGGRFAADTGITTEILCNAKVKAMIRLGSCGSLSDKIKVEIWSSQVRRFPVKGLRLITLMSILKFSRTVN